MNLKQNQLNWTGIEKIHQFPNNFKIFQETLRKVSEKLP
jgi:hypothetical protein